MEDKEGQKSAMAMAQQVPVWSYELSQINGFQEYLYK